MESRMPACLPFNLIQNITKNLGALLQPENPKFALNWKLQYFNKLAAQTAATKVPGAITASTGRLQRCCCIQKFTSPDGGCTYNTGWLQTKGPKPSRINRSRTLMVAAAHF